MANWHPLCRKMPARCTRRRCVSLLENILRNQPHCPSSSGRSLYPKARSDPRDQTLSSSSWSASSICFRIDSASVFDIWGALRLWLTGCRRSCSRFPGSPVSSSTSMRFQSRLPTTVLCAIADERNRLRQSSCINEKMGLVVNNLRQIQVPGSGSTGGLNYRAAPFVRLSQGRTNLRPRHGQQPPCLRARKLIASWRR